MGATPSKRKILFVEPQAAPSPRPILDSITRKMCAAFRHATQSEYAYGGVHQCLCGATSSCCDHFLPDGTMTNSLCIHYVAHHRPSVPSQELRLIPAFEWGEAEPNDRELSGPELMAASIRRFVERSMGHTALDKWRAWGLDLEALCAQMRSFDPGNRQAAEELFSLLRFFSRQMPAFSAALERGNLNAATWGDESLRLPDWNRGAWLPPKMALLHAQYDDQGERRRVAFHFRYLRVPGAPVPQELTKLSQTADVDIKRAISLAIEGLSEG
jgi:hypothetical protein